MRKKFIEILQTPAEEGVTFSHEIKELAAQIALEIEDNLSGKYIEKKGYAEKARSLVFNLKDSKNPKLREKLISGDITSMDFITLEPRELASDFKKLEREKTLEANMAERRTDW